MDDVMSALDENYQVQITSNAMPGSVKHVRIVHIPTGLADTGSGTSLVLTKRRVFARLLRRVEEES